MLTSTTRAPAGVRDRIHSCAILNWANPFIYNQHRSGMIDAKALTIKSLTSGQVIVGAGLHLRRVANAAGIRFLTPTNGRGFVNHDEPN